MTGLHQILNFIIVILLLSIVLCFLLLAHGHTVIYLRTNRKNKRKNALYATLAQHIEGHDTTNALIKYRTRQGIAVLSEALEESNDAMKRVALQMVREAGFEAYIRRQLETGDIAYCTLLIKVIGDLRLLGFSDYISDFLYQYKGDAKLQYVGFMTLALLGDGDALIEICLDDAFSQSLSFRSLKEIFKQFTGERTSLCEALLSAPDNYIRRIVLNMIGEYRLTMLAPQAMKLVHALDINIVIDAVRCLGQLQYAPVVPALRELMGHERWEVRNAVIHAFAAINLEQYALDIAKGLSDREWWVRYNAASALSSYSRVKELQKSPLVMGDRFATEILQYAIQRRAIRREVHAV